MPGPTAPPSPMAIFNEALDFESPEDRAAYLARACAGDPALRARVETLLAVHDRAGEFLESPAVVTTTPWGPMEGVGTDIGPYKLKEQIGEGGMGLVYVAEQTEPVRRKVALKIIKPGLDTKQVVARFEAERQALALMDHPNIARVLDAGAAESGRPYFVMELVRGIPITDYCDKARVSVRDRLGLFVAVCQAVQHAHQKGIIHRDLKPSNILVTLHDGVPVPKVIDFGVAKATGQSLTDKTVYTAFTQLVGTPLYMSPEQVELSGLDIDTRSDIYSLGVLLYELLTGTTPFDSEALQLAAFDEMRRIIREDEPPKPSTRISTLCETLTDVSVNRGSDPRRLEKVVRGELDWIVMKALEKDRNRRYETANGLAADVRRYLSDEPVQACPPSAWYRFSKAARRNRTALVTTCLVALALVLGTAVSTWQAVRAIKAERAALQAEAAIRRERDRAVKAEATATESARKAKTEAAIARAISNFLQKDLLGQANPWFQPDRDLKVRTVLDRASRAIPGRFDRQPLVEAAIRQTIASTYMGLALPAEGRPHLERALELMRRERGEDHPEALVIRGELGVALRQERRFAEAEAELAGALDVGRRALGEENPQVVALMIKLTEAYLIQGKFAEAEPLAARAFEVSRRVRGEGSNESLQATRHLARVYLERGQTERAVALLTQNLEIGRRVLGEKNTSLWWPMNDLAAALERRGEFNRAQSLWNEALEIALPVLQSLDHVLIGSLAHRLGGSYAAHGQYAQAEALTSRLTAVAPATPEGRVTLGLLLNNIAWRLAIAPSTRSDGMARAIAWAKRAVELAPREAMIWNTLGALYCRNGDWSAAVDALGKSMELRNGGDSFDWFFLAMAYWHLGDRARARTWYDRAVTWMDTKKPQDQVLKQFRAEAATLLGVSELPDDVFAPP